MGSPLDDFTFINTSPGDEEVAEANGVGGPPQLSWRHRELTSAKVPDFHVQFLAELRAQHPELIVTGVPAGNVSLLRFAAAGRAKAILDLMDPLSLPVSERLFVNPPRYDGGHGEASLTEIRSYSKYEYFWGIESFILYTVQYGGFNMQYVLARPRPGEGPRNSISSGITDKLLHAIWGWMVSDQQLVWVYEVMRGWSASKNLWLQVEKTTWSNVILDPATKQELLHIADRFFDSRNTVSLKAFMNSLVTGRDPKDRIPCLYVKSAGMMPGLGAIFEFARRMAPCLLVFEDVETIVTSRTRSSFLNEVDGLENNDGILMIATTNFLDRLDPGLSRRPSRFDRKYSFPEPSLDQRVLYCQYWHGKLKESPAVEFPKHLCRPIARITGDFSFAYMQEAFVATLLTLARGDGGNATACPVGGDEGGGEDDKDDPEQYEFFRVIKKHIKTLRDDMGSSSFSADDYYYDEMKTMAERGTAPPPDKAVRNAAIWAPGVGWRFGDALPTGAPHEALSHYVRQDEPARVMDLTDRPHGLSW
ncbi:hypothetical protein PG994_000986 [Apiospora phragmitis]|uniref:ATPase AAA-type core domain-containing protein n=1 Tax=Apiospora phragmitis TaxID=2905665 RepID=A0ABR1WR43_9PEZI